MADDRPTQTERRTTRRLEGRALEGPLHCRRCERIWRNVWIETRPQTTCIFCGFPTAAPICPGIQGEN
jgi:hypothetical protein